jgi:hypothetical protein
MAQQPNSTLGRLIVGISGSHTIRHTHTPGRTALNEWSARRRGRYLHNTQQTEQSSSSSAGFEPVIPATKRQQTYALRLHGHRDQV